MESVWSAKSVLPKFKPLTGCAKADVAVIGAGMAGVLTAYLLNRQGASVVVLEAGTLGCGATRNTTAKITAQHSLIYDSLISDFSEEQARHYAEANRAAVGKYMELIAESQISCHFETCAAYCYDRENPEKIEKEARAAERLGFSASFTTETELPFPVAGAVRFEDQGRFHPLEFLGAIAKDLTIYENTTAREIDGKTVMTDHGKVTAEQVVVASHYPFINVPGYYFARMHQERSYVLALSNAGRMGNMYLDARDGGYSFRGYEDLLLLGGGGHRTGKFDEKSGYGPLSRAAKEFYPQAQEEYRWSAQDCMTLDGVPYIGQYASSLQNVYVATGFQKWGMTGSMVSAMLLSDQILGRENPCAEVFSPQRFKVSASVKNLLAEGAQAAAGLARQVFSGPDGELDKIEKGHGGIVEYDGQKAGVYRDEAGEVFLVTTKCPHLGCELSWNPDEKSWDCPCHGSRFDYRGNLLDNPAMRGLTVDPS